MTETEKSENKKTEGESLVPRLAALLDFFSDRATAHASLFVASIFGILTMLTLLDNITDKILILISVFPYFMFSYLGYHTLLRFGFYADIAEKVAEGVPLKDTLEKIAAPRTTPKEKDPNLWKYLLYLYGKQKQILLIPMITDKLGSLGKYFLCAVYWAIVSVIGFIVYSDLEINIESIAAISLILFFLFVILPPINYLINENKKTE